jgi:hypothetical protein
MKRYYDFICENGHITEKYTEYEDKETGCQVCNLKAQRTISATRFKLDGCSGDFPTAADAWVNKRSEKLKQEQKASYAER